MSVIYCFNCKRWIPLGKWPAHTKCVFRFCACERGRPCKFHARGAYTTWEDEIVSYHGGNPNTEYP